MTDSLTPPRSELEAARAFVTAIAWGEHRKVWELLGPEGRKTVLRVAVSAGMDEALVGRLREGTATEGEQNEFLTDLVNGLRADLAGADLDGLQYEFDPEPQPPGQARVVLADPVPDVLGGGGLPVGWLDLVDDGETWRVERLIPRTSR